MIKVWHVNVEKIGRQNYLVVCVGFDEQEQAREAKRLFDEGFYEQVAEISTDDLEVAWRLTNHIDTSWSMNPADIVKVVGSDNVRSSMVGDIFIQNGIKYVVANVGFKPI